jgi:hypothetical protein
MVAEPPVQIAAEFTLTVGLGLTVKVPEPLPVQSVELLSVTTTV